MHRNEFHNTFTGGLELKYVKKKNCQYDSKIKGKHLPYIKYLHIQNKLLVIVSNGQVVWWLSAGILDSDSLLFIPGTRL